MRRNGGDGIKFSVVGAMLDVMKGTNTYATELIVLHSALEGAGRTMNLQHFV